MLQALRRDGYALAKVATPDAVLITAEHALDVAYTVTPGPRVDLGPIAVNGLVRTDAGFVRRRLLVRQGEQFDPDKIEKARRDLTDLGVFATVRASTADSLDAGGQLPLAFDVTERARHAVGLTGSYSTDLGATAGATFELRNVFGQAELLRLGAAVTQLGGSASRSPGYDVTASLTKPDVFTRDQSVTGTLRAVKEDLDAYDRTAFIAGLSGTRKLSDHWSVSAGLLGTQSKVTQEAVTRDYTLLGLPLGAIYNTVPTDQLLEPISGVKAVLTVTPTANLGGAGGGDGGREQGGSSFTLIQLAGSTYLDLPWLGGAPGRSVLAARALVGSAQGASTFQLPPDQRFYAGGGGTVRGYKYQSIGPRFASNRPVGGTSVTAGSIEFRQRFLSSFGVAAFIDAGQVGTSSAPFSGDLKVGAGLGARYYTPIGPIRLDVALPLNKERGDDAFELYIGIGQAF
jgi:translocation and assembly module TamA